MRKEFLSDRRQHRSIMRQAKLMNRNGACTTHWSEIAQNLRESSFAQKLALHLLTEKAEEAGQDLITAGSTP